MRQAMVPEGRIPCPHQVAAVFFTDAPKTLSFVQAVDAPAASSIDGEMRAVSPPLPFHRPKLLVASESVLCKKRRMAWGYPKYDERITQDMKQETMLFFEEILNKDLSILNVIDSDFTFLNRRLANHYGVPFPETEHIGFVRVPGTPPQLSKGGYVA
jgi:hypothetical protein